MNKNIKILIIEDDPIQLTLIQKVMTQIIPQENMQGFLNAVDALEYLRTKDTDIIILDIFLPEMSGLSFLDQMKELYDRQKKRMRPEVAVCTTAESREYRAQAFKKGIMDYIIKPFAPEELIIRIKRIIEFKEMETKINKLENSALKDPLTGLWNRRALEEELERMSQFSQRYKMEYSVLMIDLDQFKKFNDTYGHLEGDSILRIAGDVIRETIRKSDFAGRFGGEEFIIILPYTDERGANVIGTRLFQKIVDKNVPHRENPPYNIVTFTVGVAVKEENENVVRVIKKADEALYYGKKHNQKIVLFSELVVSAEK